MSNRKHRNIPKNNNKRRKEKLIVFDSNPAIKKITGNKRIINKGFELLTTSTKIKHRIFPSKMNKVRKGIII